MNRRPHPKEMANKYNLSIGSWWIYMFIAMLDIISHSCVGDLQTLDKFAFGPKPKGTIKTIEIIDDGDVIDCVLFYKQPAFDNPALKGLKIKHSSYQTLLNKTKPKITQSWNKYGECPEGTIPIRRTWNNTDTTHPKYSNDVGIHEYAAAIHTSENCKGGRARLNVWKPLVLNQNEFSLSQIWIVAGPRAELNSIEAGWVVYPDKYGSRRTRFFIYYTPDGYKTKCWDLECGGFVQVDHEFVLGKILEPSEYGGEQKDMLISVSKDRDDGHWWLTVDDKIVGFWPHTLFKILADGADSVTFGGEIVNQKETGIHTTTKMGSGSFPAEGYKKACYTSNIQVVNDAFEWVEPNLNGQIITRRECYDLKFGPPSTNLGSHIYFGGLGQTRQCR